MRYFAFVNVRKGVTERERESSECLLHFMEKERKRERERMSL